MPDQRPARKKLFDMAEAGVPVEEPRVRRRLDAAAAVHPALRLRERAHRRRARAQFAVLEHPSGAVQERHLRGVDIFGHGPNNDGVDPESVDHMLIEDCSFDTGDDCIAVNSGRNADGRRLATPSQNILVRNCRMKEGHGGVVVGSQISGGARWVFAENCHMDSPDLWYAIRFKNNALRGGLLENFYYRDIDVGQVGRAAITCDFNYEEGPNGPFIAAAAQRGGRAAAREERGARAGFARAAAGAGERHHAARLRIRWRDRSPASSNTRAR